MLIPNSLNIDSNSPSLKKKKSKETESWVERIITWILEFLTVIFFCLFILRVFVFQQYTVSGTSMLPNIKDGQILFVNTWSYKFSEPQRGDIVVLIPPFDVAQNYVKRVVGLPNEIVEIKGDNQVIIYNTEYPNGIVLKEDYLPETQETMGYIREQLTPNEYFVLGDNRKASRDSRGNISDIDTAWHLPKENIRGKAVFIGNEGEYFFELGNLIKLPRLEYITSPQYNL